MSKTSRVVVATTLVAAAAVAVGFYLKGGAPNALEVAETVPVAAPASAAEPRPPAVIDTVPGMPPVPDPTNLYSETGSAHLAPAVASMPERIYVPNRIDGTVSVLDPVTMKVVSTYRVGINPQHVIPSWDLRSLWVANNAEGRTKGSTLMRIDPMTGKRGKIIEVEDPYNMYWTPDGKHAIVVAEAYKRLDFRDSQSMTMQYSIDTPDCPGINHADFSIDGRFAVFTCEFGGSITKIDLGERKVLATTRLSRYFNRPDALALVEPTGTKPRKTRDPADPSAEICITPGMPQDVRISPDGKLFYVADMMSEGVHVVDAQSLEQVGFVPTGIGAHGLYPSRDGRFLYVANRGTNEIRGRARGKGSVSVLEFATGKVVQTWTIPGGGSPDMGNVSVDGRYLWLSGRYDNVVYRIDTASGGVDQVKVGHEPHGLAVWPQPGRYSLGHTGNMR